MKARDPKQAPCLKLTTGEESEAKSGADQKQTESRREQEESREEQKKAEEKQERAEREQRGFNERAKQQQPPSL